MERYTSCLAYLIWNGGVEKLLSVSSIIQTLHKLSEPTSGAAAQRKRMDSRIIHYSLNNYTNIMQYNKLRGQNNYSAYQVCGCKCSGTPEVLGG